MNRFVPSLLKLHKERFALEAYSPTQNHRDVRNLKSLQIHIPLVKRIRIFVLNPDPVFKRFPDCFRAQLVSGRLSINGDIEVCFVIDF